MRGYAWSVVVMATGCTAGGGRAKGGGDGAGSECGYNTVDLGSSCECLDPYLWCDDDSLDCCAYDSTEFDIVLESFEIFPLKDSASASPWDWDGDIPDEWIQLASIIGYFDPTVKTAAEVMEAVDTYAPELLEDTVPPDPWLDFYQGNEYLDSTGTFDDTYSVRPNTVHTLDLSRGEWAYEVWDEDIIDHDYVGEFYITLDDAQWTAGRTVMWDYHPLWEVKVRVDPVN